MRIYITKINIILMLCIFCQNVNCQPQFVEDKQGASKAKREAWKHIGNWERSLKRGEDPGTAYCQIAIGYEDLQMKDEMVKYFKLALEHSPNNPDILYQMAMGYMEFHEWDLALNTMAKAKNAAASIRDQKLIKLTTEGYDILEKQIKMQQGKKIKRWKIKKVGDKFIFYERP